MKAYPISALDKVGSGLGILALVVIVMDKEKGLRDRWNTLQRNEEKSKCKEDERCSPM